jgi:hypothetical protein
VGKPVRRTNDPSILADPRARYMLLVEGALAEIVPRLEQLDPPVTYHTFFGDFSGGPGMTIWWGFARRADRERAQSSGLIDEIRQVTATALVAKGYPEAAVASELFIGFTSDEEIEAGGGEFTFFR